MATDDWVLVVGNEAGFADVSEETGSTSEEAAVIAVTGLCVVATAAGLVD